MLYSHRNYCLDRFYATYSILTFITQQFPAAIPTGVLLVCCNYVSVFRQLSSKRKRKKRRVTTHSKANISPMARKWRLCDFAYKIMRNCAISWYHVNGISPWTRTNLVLCTVCQYVHYFIRRLSSEELRFHCIVVSPIFHILPAMVAAFMVSWDELFYSLLGVFSLFYQKCLSCFHLAIIFKIWSLGFCFRAENGW
jgi:hypothetical protein